MSGSEDLIEQVQYYRELVLKYEALNLEISQLLMDNDGASENMTAKEFAHYRVLAKERDRLQDEIRVIELELMDEDTTP